MIERQVIVTWYTPDEKLPPEGIEVICTINGKTDSVCFENAMEFLIWDKDTGWWSAYHGWIKELEVIAWCDLMPYGYKEK